MFLKNNLHYLFSPGVESSIHRNKHLLSETENEKKKREKTENDTFIFSLELA